MSKFNAIASTYADVAQVDVLFVTNQTRIPVSLTNHLDENDLKWARVIVKEFPSLIDDLKLVGTVVVDTSEVTEKQRHRFITTLKKLEANNIAAILINDFIGFPFSDFRLATLLQSASPAEVQGRIESNIIYYNSLAGSPTKEPPAEHNIYDGQLAEDTLEQLRMAGDVQRSFLPRHLPNSDKLHFSVVFQPADYVSGDFYDITRLDERHVGFYLADAVGHSVPAALLSMFIKRAIIMRETRDNDYEIFSPQDVIGRANNALVREELPGCLFATVCYFLLNFETMQMTYCRAGHPYPILIKKGQKPIQLQSRGGLLGVFADGDFHQETISLEQGDKIIVYSDGCEDLIGCCDDNNQFVFKDSFLSMSHLPAEEILSRIENRAKTRHVPKAEKDDVTVIGLEIL